jgi:hypothetical protein
MDIGDERSHPTRYNPGETGVFILLENSLRPLMVGSRPVLGIRDGDAPPFSLFPSFILFFTLLQTYVCGLGQTWIKCQLDVCLPGEERTYEGRLAQEV